MCFYCIIAGSVLLCARVVFTTKLSLGSFTSRGTRMFDKILKAFLYLVMVIGIPGIAGVLVIKMPSPPGTLGRLVQSLIVVSLWVALGFVLNLMSDSVYGDATQAEKESTRRVRDSVLVWMIVAMTTAVLIFGRCTLRELCWLEVTVVVVPLAAWAMRGWRGLRAARRAAKEEEEEEEEEAWSEIKRL